MAGASWTRTLLRESPRQPAAEEDVAMKYKHERTGAIVDIPFEVRSRLWKPVNATEAAAAPKPAAAQKPAAAPKSRRKEK